MLDHLSYSSITTFLSCPAYWERKYILKEKTYSSPELVFGSALHGTLEEYLTTKGNLLETWDKNWKDTLADTERGEVVWGADTPEEHYNEGVRMLNHPAIQAGIEAIHAQYEGGEIEQKVELRVPGVPVPIVGYIDVILRDGIPADFKTSSRSWNQERAQSELQSLFYLAALNQAGEIIPGWKFKHFIFVKTKTPQFQMLEHSHNPKEIFWMFHMIQQVWNAIQAGVFFTNPGGWRCGPAYCDFWTRCRGKV